MTKSETLVCDFCHKVIRPEGFKRTYFLQVRKEWVDPISGMVEICHDPFPLVQSDLHFCSKKCIKGDKW